MNHPLMHDVGNTQQYSAAPHPPAPGHYGALPPAPPPGAPGQPPSPARRRWVMPAVVGGTAVVALIAGVTLGAAFGGSGASNSGTDNEGPVAIQSDPTGVAGGGAPSPAEVHAQDVSLCTSYAIINSAIPRPDRVGSDLLPAVTALKVALDDNPHASAPVRVAVTDIASVYQARVAEHGKVRARGLAEPPPYSLDAEKRAVDQVWNACGLDEE